ncbi:hypothetical protein Rhopal_006018-T1 [Rhodotorula paludigena]|uniref:Protein kinase domain-containing protein n=1 Tax=Rhodotorula paludigena TaxID=86838 RepID=A0AAV5GRW2_9BASI|nr:hypothetical protein Rhopal_006018-T1 [Rhodotorula paludigena]
MSGSYSSALSLDDLAPPSPADPPATATPPPPADPRSTLGRGLPLSPRANAAGDDAVMHDAADDPLPRAESGRCTSPTLLDGDTRMRGMSEEPTSAPVNIASPATNGHALTQSPSSTPSSSLHRSASTSTAPSGATVQRNPSLRARDAFSRLRIGSAGSSPRPAVPPPPSSSSPSASLAAAQTANPKPPTRAASFLSAFSPPSSVGSGGGRSPSPPLASTPSSSTTTAATTTAPRRAFPPLASIALPPRGDEQGFVLRTRDERGTEWEVELGRELGRGGMGTVREAVRRRVRGRRRARRGEDDDEMRDDDEEDEGRESEEEEDEDDVRALAVKIIPRANPYFVKLDRAALGLGLGAGASSDLAQAAAAAAAGGGPSASAGVAANPHLQGLVHHLHPSPCPTPPAPLASSLEPGQSARDRVRHVGERARSASSPFARPGLGSRAASLATVQGTPRMGRSPESEEVPGVEVLGSSAPGRGDGFFAAAVDAERGGKGGGDEGAAIATQDGNNNDDDEEPVDLLDLLLQREISIWRQLSALPSPFANPAHRTRWTGRGGHPHIVALVDTHRSADYDYVFMPLAEGGTLFEYVTDPRVRARQPQPATSASSTASSSSRGRSKSRSRPRPRASIPIAGTAASSLSPPPPTAGGAGAGAGIGLAEAGEFFVQLADAVRWMHDVAGVAHRDLKLENVVGCWEVPSSTPSSASLRKGKARRVWKLADFGLAEVIPAPAPAAAAPAPAPAPAVQGVQPLSALARAGSLHRGPSGPSAGDAAQPASAGPMSQSAFLPAPHRTVGSPAPAPGPAVPHNSPLSALLHPVGSLPYSSPEALRSSVPIVHPSGDIWALGCVLYAMIAGRLPIWEEWELRLRVRLMKGDWDVPDELDPAQAADAGDRDERTLALDVLRGCLDKDVDRRWTIRQVCESAWVARVRERVAAEREREREFEQAARDGRDGGDRTRLDSLRRERDDNLSPLPAATPTATGAPSPTTTTTTTTTGGRTPSRGRLPTRTAYAATNGGPPPAPSAGKSTDPSPDGNGGSSSSARQKSTSRSRTRLATRSSSRSSAYAHQFGPASDEADRERRERGRSERRLRWDEAGGAGAGSARRRSSSRASSSTSASVAALENGGAGAEQQQQQQEPASGPRRGRSASRRRQQQEEWERDERERQRQREGHGGLATVGEPY